MNLLLLIAQGTPQGGGFGWSTLIMFGSMFLIFYFMIIRPQQKRTKERQKMLDAVAKGDKIVTSGGLHGTVDRVEDKTIIVQVSDNVKLKFDRSAIAVIENKTNVAVDSTKK